MSKDNPLAGHLAVVANTCHDCGGPLRAEDGSFSERLHNVTGQVGYAAAICNGCKAGQRKVNCDAREAGLECELPPKHRGKHKWRTIDG